MRGHFVYLALVVLLTAVLAACGENEAESIEPTEESTPERVLTILSVEGTVQVRVSPDAEPAAARPDQVLTIGAEVITGADGQAVLAMDDGTTIVIPSESSFVVQALEGTPDSPISRFFLNLGEVFAFREGELPEDASFEIETPNGVAAIRGSMIHLTANLVTGQVEATCLVGHCSLTAAGVTVDLTDGQSVIVEGFDLPPGEVFVMDDSQLQAWIDAAAAAGVAIHLLPEAAPEVTEEPEPECVCVGPNLVCDDDTISEDDEDCLAACACEGYDLVCEDGAVIEGHEECGWACDPALTCGNDTCDTACENSDVCPDDCVCTDDGLCSPGEGFNCRDCIGPDEDPSSVCGVPCQDTCSGDLACVEGICWDPCLCGGSCGGESPDCPVHCWCHDAGTLKCVDCEGNYWLESSPDC